MAPKDGSSSHSRPRIGNRLSPAGEQQIVPSMSLQSDSFSLQKYYNVPAHDPLGQQADFDMFFTIQEVLNDRLGGAMCTGTGYVVRRSALTEIGGWPLAETGEDYMCSALLSDAGWKIAFVRENLQLGLAPGSLLGLLKQRMRWVKLHPPPLVLKESVQYADFFARPTREPKFISILGITCPARRLPRR